MAKGGNLHGTVSAFVPDATSIGYCRIPGFFGGWFELPYAYGGGCEDMMADKGNRWIEMN